MKAYINYFADSKSTRETFGSDEFIDGMSYVMYGDAPAPWKLSSLEAEKKLILLKRHNVKDQRFPAHICEFEIEKVGEDEYVIFCNDRPDFLPAPVRPD